MTNENCHDFEMYDRSLTLFRSSPLVWVDRDNHVHPLPTLDLDREGEIIQKALENAQEEGGARIELLQEVATVDRLIAFLATRQSPVVHFSGHCHKEYLAIENGWGAMQTLMMQDLKELFSGGRGDGQEHFVKVVFLSASHSRVAGEALVAAGIPHVVCCEKNERNLHDEASLVFTAAFYKALACERTLRDAYEMSKREVLMSPNFQSAQMEMGTFALLPIKPQHDDYHDVRVFVKQPRPNRRGNTGVYSPPGRSFPLPPKHFMGREETVYSVLASLRDVRIVQLEGRRGIGKSSVAKAVCKYIHDRSRTCGLERVSWFPPVWGAADDLTTGLSELEGLLYLEDDTPRIPYEECCGNIIRALKEESTLMAMDVRQLNPETGIDKLSLFLEDVIRGTRNVKVLLVCPDGLVLQHRHGCLHGCLPIEPLDVRSSVVLFCTFCPFVSQHRCPLIRTPKDLADLLDLSLTRHDKSNSDNELIVQELVGAGVPEMIVAAARSMTPEQYDDLLRIVTKGEIREGLSELTERREREATLCAELDAAVSKEEYAMAHDIHMELEELRIENMKLNWGC